MQIVTVILLFVELGHKMNNWILALDNFMVTDVVYIDFQKAFDMVSVIKTYCI